LNKIGNETPTIQRFCFLQKSVQRDTGIDS
jgi:hypothetical protein